MPATRERPWLRYYGAVPASIDYPRITLYEAVAATAQRSPDAVAWDFFGTTATYRVLLASIDTAAAALASLGLKAGDRLLISMPTAPAGVIAFYAANKLGAVSALIDFCRERLIKWSCPREVEFRRELPKTRVGKIDFKVLVAEHVDRSGG